MYRAQPVHLQQSPMHRGTVALMVIESVERKLFMQSPHGGVAMNLCHNRGGSDKRMALVAFNDGFLMSVGFRRIQAAVKHDTEAISPACRAGRV